MILNLFWLTICSICYNTDNWQLMSKYSKRFVKAGVKLRQTAFDLWMEFAAKIGFYKFSVLLYYVLRPNYYYFFYRHNAILSFK